MGVVGFSASRRNDHSDECETHDSQVLERQVENSSQSLTAYFISHLRCAPVWYMSVSWTLRDDMNQVDGDHIE